MVPPRRPRRMRPCVSLCVRNEEYGSNPGPAMKVLICLDENIRSYSYLSH